MFQLFKVVLCPAGQNPAAPFAGDSDVKMPLLRSQTRGEAKAGVINDLIQQKPLSTSLPTVITSLQEEEKLLTLVRAHLDRSPSGSHLEYWCARERGR